MAWTVVQVHPNRVSQACKHLTRQGFVHYNPCYLSQKGFVKQLFTGYLFTKDCSGRWRELLSTTGISCVLMSGLERPSEISDQVVDSLMSRESNGYIQLGDPFYIGQQVRIIEGPFANTLVLYGGQRDRDRVSVLFNLFGRKTIAYVDEGNLVAA